MGNIVYIRIVAYVLSTLAGLIPAAWAGWASYDAAAGTVVVSIEGLAVALVAAIAGSLAIFRKWGVK